MFLIAALGHCCRKILRFSSHGEKTVSLMIRRPYHVLVCLPKECVVLNEISHHMISISDLQAPIRLQF